MYGWIVDGISSLFEQKSTEKRNRGEVEPRRRWQERLTRAAKRNYDSVHVSDGVHQSDQIEAKRRKRDVVVSFVKKTLTGVADLLRLQKPLTSKCENERQRVESQSITLKGIDELQASWMSSSEWRMDKPINGKNPFHSTVPPLIRKYSGTSLNGGLLDRVKDGRERRGSLHVFPSKPAIRLETPTPDPDSKCLGHNRCYKPSLTVEETIKQNNKEHYRRLLEMVTEKYNKSLPLPFNQAKPQEDLLFQVHKTAVPEKTFPPVSRNPGYTTSPSMMKYRNGSIPKERWSSLTSSKSSCGSLNDTQPVPGVQQSSRDLDLSTEVASRLSLEDKQTSAGNVPRKQSEYMHPGISDDNMPRLTQEMTTEVSRALACSDPNLILSAAFKLCITQQDLATLQDGGWLNDVVINFYMSLIMERCYTGEGQLKVYTFSTFFFTKLNGRGGGQAGGHAAVKRWTKSVDLFLFDLILVPLHLGIHWALAVIDFRSKTVKSYDSMGQRHDDICNLLLMYIKEEHLSKKGKRFDCSKWTIKSLTAGDIPQQKNGSDCGIFACKYADYIARGRPLTFKQCHMPFFRKLMIWEILNQRLR